MPTTRKCRNAVALAAAALALGLPAGAQQYKWPDANGRMQYGDIPPDTVKRQDVKLNVRSYTGNPEVDDWTATDKGPGRGRDLGAAKGQPALTLYSASWCGPCKRAKAWLGEQGIAYRNIDIDESDANKAEFRSYGGGGVPLFIAGKKRMRGFRAESLQQFLAEAR